MVLVYDKWDVSGIKIDDPGLKGYINIEPRVVPRTGGRNAKNRFHKNNVFIIERLMNKIMGSCHRAKKHKIQKSGRQTGKGETVYNIMKKVLDTIEAKTKTNPIAVVVKAIENAAPREDIVTIEYGGARYPKSVEVAPQRRVDFALRLMTQIAAQKAFQSKKTYVNCLTDEILSAYNLSQTSGAVSKKLELERQADSSR